MTKAFKAKVQNPLRKLVLIKLADNANDRGVCHPSYQHIADQCEISRRSVIEHVKVLQEMGVLTVKNRFNDCENTSNSFHICEKKLEELSSAPNSLGSKGAALGSANGAKKHASNSLGSEGAAPPLVKELHPEPSLSNHHLTIKNHHLTKERVNALPDWLDVDLWNDWLDSRKKLKAVNSERALAIILKKITAWQEQGHNPNSIIETSLVNGWKDCYLPKQANGKPTDDGYADFVAQTEAWEARSKRNASGQMQKTGNVYEGVSA